MKNLFMILLFVFLLCVSFGCQKQVEEVAEEPAADAEAKAAAEVAADVEAIKGILAEWVTAYNAGELDRLVDFYFAENAVFKLDHAILSALLMKRWNFPQSIMLPCRFHHNPESSPIKFKHQSLIINLADYLTQKAGIGHSGNPVPVTVKNSPKKIGVNQAILKLTIDQLRRKEDEIKEFFKITTEA